MYTVGIITISDKGAAGQREDKSGPKIKELLPKDKYDVVSYKIIPDERKLIADELVRLCDDEELGTAADAVVDDSIIDTLRQVYVRKLRDSGFEGRVSCVFANERGGLNSCKYGNNKVTG